MPTVPTGRQEIILKSVSRRTGRRFYARGLRLWLENEITGLGEALVLRVVKTHSFETSAVGPAKVVLTARSSFSATDYFSRGGRWWGVGGSGM